MVCSIASSTGEEEAMTEAVAFVRTSQTGYDRFMHCQMESAPVGNQKTTEYVVL